MARFRLVKRPPKANIRMRTIQAQVRKDIKQVNKKHIELRKKVTRTWSSSKRPKFKPETPKTQNNVTIFKIKVEGGRPPGIRKNITYWRLLNDGTKVRHALLLPKPYLKKTRPGVLDSFPGRGNVQAIVSKRLFNFPGIKPGAWDEATNVRLEDFTTQIIIGAYISGFRQVSG